jgi:hypothetical protein
MVMGCGADVSTRTGARAFARTGVDASACMGVDEVACTGAAASTRTYFSNSIRADPFAWIFFAKEI